jgi:hypothetical protein
VVLDKNNDQSEQTDVQVTLLIMQPEADVTQQYVQNNIESRLSMLEIELNAIKELILINADFNN